MNSRILNNVAELYQQFSQFFLKFYKICIHLHTWHTCLFRITIVISPAFHYCLSTLQLRWFIHELHEIILVQLIEVLVINFYTLIQSSLCTNPAIIYTLTVSLSCYRSPLSNNLKSTPSVPHSEKYLQNSRLPS